MSKKDLWYNPKFGKQGFVGTYEFKSGSRYLVLTGAKSGRRVELESHEVARRLGWNKAFRIKQ